jgi:hypothetical protein
MVMEDRANVGRLQVAEHDGERMRETIEAQISEHITQETYEQWCREAPPGRSVRSSGGARSIVSKKILRSSAASL